MQGIPWATSTATIAPKTIMGLQKGEPSPVEISDLPIMGVSDIAIVMRFAYIPQNVCDDLHNV